MTTSTPAVAAISSALATPFERFDHHRHQHVVVDRGAIVDPGPHLTERSAARTAAADRRIAREARRIPRLERIVHGRHDDADGADVGRFLDARFERVGHADHRRRADAGTREHHAPHLVPRHRAVLHLEPDEVEVLADLAVQLRVVGRDRVAGDLLVLEQQLLGLVVERPRRGRADRGLHLPAPAARIDRRHRDGAACRRSTGPACRCRRAGGTAAALSARSGRRLRCGLLGVHRVADPESETCCNHDTHDAHRKTSRWLRDHPTAPLFRHPERLTGLNQLRQQLPARRARAPRRTNSRRPGRSMAISRRLSASTPSRIRSSP